MDDDRTSTSWTDSGKKAALSLSESSLDSAGYGPGVKFNDVVVPWVAAVGSTTSG